MKPFIETSSLVLLAILTALLLCVNVSAATRSIECEVHFPFDSVDYNAGEFDECLRSAKAQKADLQFVHIFATASFPGTLRYNRLLADRRAEALSSRIQTMFPKAQVRSMGGGEHTAGQSAKVFFLASESESPAMTAQRIGAKSDGPSTRFRVAIRGGKDFHADSDTRYNQVGAEMGYRFNSFTRLFTPEAGIAINHLSEDDVRDLYSQEGFGGVSLNYGLLLAGLRGKVSNLSRNDMAQNRFDAGADARLGIEGKRWSLVGSYGQTASFSSQVRIEVGARL